MRYTEPIAHTEAAMALQPKSDATQEPLPPDPYPAYRPVYGWIFQAWLVMFLAVICLALVAYLLSYIPKGWLGG
jgi:hypothetical protein